MDLREEHQRLMKKAAQQPGVADVVKLYETLHERYDAYQGLVASQFPETISSTRASCE